MHFSWHFSGGLEIDKMAILPYDIGSIKGNNEKSDDEEKQYENSLPESRHRWEPGSRAHMNNTSELQTESRTCFAEGDFQKADMIFYRNSQKVCRRVGE